MHTICMLLQLVSITEWQISTLVMALSCMALLTAAQIAVHKGKRRSYLNPQNDIEAPAACLMFKDSFGLITNMVAINDGTAGMLGF